MKKFLGVILINILLGIIFILILELILYIKFYHVPAVLMSVPTMQDKYNELKNSGYLEEGVFQDVYKWRMPVGLEYKNPPIVVFGGSFAWGALLNTNETFAAKLSKLTKSPAYNFAISGWGIQQTLFLLQQDDFYNLVKGEEPQYAVFVFISNHISRLYKYGFMRKTGREYDCNYLRYVKSGNHLVKEKDYKYYLPYSHLYFFIREKISEKEERKTEESFDLMKLHFEECKNAMKKHWKNTKFVILVYESEGFFNTHPEIISSERWKELEEEGFIVLKTSQLTNIPLTKEYENRPDENHPSEKAWDLITPLFVKAVNQKL